MQFPIHQEFTHAISKDDPLEPTMAASLQWGKESDEEGGETDPCFHRKTRVWKGGETAN